MCCTDRVFRDPSDVWVTRAQEDPLVWMVYPEHQDTKDRKVNTVVDNICDTREMT